jgi:hypothetical protein
VAPPHRRALPPTSAGAAGRAARPRLPGVKHVGRSAVSCAAMRSWWRYARSCVRAATRSDPLRSAPVSRRRRRRG